MMAGGTASPTIVVLGPRAQGRADLLKMLAAEGFRAVDAASEDHDPAAPPRWSRASEAGPQTDPLDWSVPPQRKTVLVVDLSSEVGSDAGEAICRQLRNSPAAAGMPLLVVVGEHLAGAGGAGERSRLLEAGADACLARPIDAGELTATLRALLRIRGEVFDLQRRTGELRLSLAERSEAVERWHALFSSSSAAIVTIDSEGSVQAWNPSAERLFGWKAHEVIGAPPPFIPPEGEPEYRRTLAALSEGSEISSIETVRVHRDGTRVPVALSRAAIFDEHGRHRGSIATLVDVTQASADRDRAAELGALLATLVDRAPIGLAFLDTDLRFQRVNQELADLDGLPTAAHAGRHVSDVLARSPATFVPLLHEVMRSRTPCLDVELSVVVPTMSGAAAVGGEGSKESEEPGERRGTTPANGATDEARAWLASLYPVETTDGVLLGVGLIIHDVTERRRIDAERARLFRAEHAARHRAQQLQTALAAVAAASTRSEVGQALIDLGLPALGAEAGVLEVTEPPEPDHTLVLASTGYEGTVLASGQRHLLDVVTPIGDVIRRGVPVYLSSAEELAERYPAAGDLLLRRGHTAWAALPLRSGGEVLGALGLAFREGQSFRDQDRLVFGGFISQAADALARAGRQEAEHDLAVTLQQSLLTADPLPTESTSVSVRYLPAVSALEVGGDFYDAVHLDEHRMLLIVGDVVGHGLEAAVAMGQLRSAAQALATAHGPAGLLSALDRFVTSNEQARFATVACVLLDPVRGEVRYSLAGHPPPMVRRPDGSVIQLASPRGAPLGTTTGPRLEGRVALTGPSLVVLYTDGLIERRHEAITVGLDRLAGALVDIHAADSTDICDYLIDRMLSDYAQRDDAVIVCAATRPTTIHHTLEVQAQPVALAGLRAGLRVWLSQLGAGPDEVSDILVAVIEAATNAIEHAGLTSDDTVVVEVEHSPPGKVTFVVRDRGRWRDGSSDPYRGRGIAIMHRLMDHVDIKASDEGTTVTLQKHLEGEPA